MTKLLEKVFSEVEKLPEQEQNRFAQWIMAELEDEKKWAAAFANSQNQLQLSKIAAKVQADIKAGKVKKIGLDEL